MQHHHQFVFNWNILVGIPSFQFKMDRSVFDRHSIEIHCTQTHFSEVMKISSILSLSLYVFLSFFFIMSQSNKIKLTKIQEKKIPDYTPHVCFYTHIGVSMVWVFVLYNFLKWYVFFLLLPHVSSFKCNKKSDTSDWERE